MTLELLRVNAPDIPRPYTPLHGAPRKYTADDILFLQETGFLDPGAKFELLDGEIVPVPPKGRRHEAMRERVAAWLSEPWARAFRVLHAHTLRLDDGTLLEPDALLFDPERRIPGAPLAGGDIRLVIEVADKSWLYDTRAKAAKYAAFGVAEYWVLHAVGHAVRMHRGPGPAGWSEKRDLAPGDALSPLCAPTAELTL